MWYRVVASSSVENKSVASVKTVNSISSAPISADWAQMVEDHIIEAAQNEAETSDGCGTIDRYFENYVSPGRVIQVHHSINSQVGASDTLTASEQEEDDQMITPAQRPSKEVEHSSDQPMDEETMTIEVDTAQYERLFKDEGKRALGSSDDENSVNNIIMRVGSFVNSFNPLASSKDTKRTKLEISQSQTECEDI